MPVNDTGKVLFHKGRGNSAIQPGEWYDGPEIGPDGDYLHHKRTEAAPIAGAAPAPPVAPQAPPPQKAPPDPAPVPTVGTLRNLSKPNLAALAVSRGLVEADKAETLTKKQLVDLIDSRR